MTRNPKLCALVASVALLGAAPSPGGLALEQEGASAGPSPDTAAIIESRSDVLPAEVLDALPPDVGRRVLGGSQPIYLLVNPALRGGEGDPAGLPEVLALEGTELPANLLAALGRRRDGRGAAVAWQVQRVLRDYLTRFFEDVRDSESLERLIQRHRLAESYRLIVLAADARAGAVREGEGPDSSLQLKLSLRLVRIELDARAPHPVAGLELLWADCARGQARLPRPGPSGELDEREVYRALRVACIEAIRGQLALSLWGNPRLRDGRWFGERPDAVGGSADPETPPAEPADAEEGRR